MRMRDKLVLCTAISMAGGIALVIAGVRFHFSPAVAFLWLGLGYGAEYIILKCPNCHRLVVLMPWPLTWVRPGELGETCPWCRSVI